MAFGEFLDAIPAAVFIGVHVVQLLIGLWILKLTMKDKPVKYWEAYCLFVLGQLVFLSFFGGLITLKMAVLLEQVLILAMVIWIALKAK